MIVIARTIADMRKAVAAWHAKGETVALIPTMGALHDGHLTLVREGRRHAQRAVATVFVNPKQFAAHEDLGKYPRTEASDIEKLQSVNTDLVFIPSPAEMYADGFATAIHMQGPAKAGLEDHFRPQFFDGVATVVAKLFIQSQADVAMFGEKDYQQLAVVTQMAKDLDIPIRVVGVPTVREADGLAMSSRNRYLSDEERQQATAIYQALSSAARAINSGTAPATATTAAATKLSEQGFRVDYVAARNAVTLAEPTSANEPLRLIAAAWLGSTRLIDNIPV